MTKLQLAFMTRVAATLGAATAQTPTQTLHTFRKIQVTDEF